jgi:hypothetical protein
MLPPIGRVGSPICNHTDQVRKARVDLADRARHSTRIRPQHACRMQLADRLSAAFCHDLIRDVHRCIELNRSAAHACTYKVAHSMSVASCSSAWMRSCSVDAATCLSRSFSRACRREPPRPSSSADSKIDPTCRRVFEQAKQNRESSCELSELSAGPVCCALC